jgi:hypothetical protein
MEDSVGSVFKAVLQHLKCIEVRLEFAKALTSQKQKYALGNAVQKVKIAINHLCDLLPSSKGAMEVKKELDDSHLVYIMLLTEQLFDLGSDDLEEVIELIDNHINKKYGKGEM